MKAPKETIYVNPDYAGSSNIVDVPMHTPINSNVVYGENPNLIVNEYGQTMVNTDIPTPINPSPTPIKETINETIQSIKDVVSDVVNPPKETPKVTIADVKNDVKVVEGIKNGTIKPSTTTTTTPTSQKSVTKPNYLLYGALGIGAVVILLGIFKKK